MRRRGLQNPYEEFDAVTGEPVSDASASPAMPDEEEAVFEPAPRQAAGSMFQVGCSWLTLIGLGLLAAGVGGLWWAVQRVQDGRFARVLPTSYQELSVLPGAPVLPAGPETTLRLYFVAQDGTLAPVERRLRAPAGGVERTHVIANELLRPPDDGSLASPLPPGAELRGVFLRDRIALVDLSREFQQPKNPTPQGERLAVFGIVDSLMLNNPDLQGVVIQIDGHPVNSAWGWLDLTSPLGPDLSLIRN